MKPSATQQEREFAFNEADFRFISQLCYSKTGIQLPDHKWDMVYSRVSRRLRALHLSSFADYCRLVQSPEGDTEIGNLINVITTNLTHFFREKHHFDHLSEQVIAPFTKGSNRRLRIWSAGCSSGMEPYSIAMTLKHAIPTMAGYDIRILATDIDTTMLDRGMRGEYSLDEYPNLPKAYRHFVTCSHESKTMQMEPALQELIAFKRLNLLEPWPMKGPFDAIFCRNVVIYFDKDTQKKLFSRMTNMLSPNGFLYIGHSENITQICKQFELVGRTIYRHAR